MLVIAILSGFYLVSFVNASFENGTSETVVFQSNSAVDFAEIEREEAPAWAYDYMVSGYYLVVGSTMENYTKTPVYLGNNTWTMSINGTDETVDNFAQYMIEIPNLDEFLITEITINQSVNTDSDLEQNVVIYCSDGEYITYGQHSDHIVGTPYSLKDIDAIEEDGWANYTETVSLADALNVYDSATNGKHYYLGIRMYDKLDDGMEEFAWNIEIEIKGKQIAQYNIVQQMEFVAGLYFVILLGTFVITNDEIDIGGYVNDIPDRKKRR